MKTRIVVTGLAIVLGTGVSLAQAVIQPQKTNERWIGMWQGQLDGQPGVILTLAERDGQLDGTVVFNVVVRQPQPHVIASEPQMLRSTSIENDTLHFQVKAFQDRPELQYNMRATGDGKADLKCLNCDGTVEVEMMRAPVYAKKH